MIRTRNATDFRIRLGECFREAARIPEFNGKLDAGASPNREAAFRERADWLEHHAREYIIDHLLESLNWSLYPPKGADAYRAQNLASEVGIASVKSETKRRLDYLGFDSETTKPLLLVEAKRPSLQLPFVDVPSASPFGHPAAVAFADFLGRLPIKGAAKPSAVRGITAEWAEYLHSVRDYVLTLGATSSVPRRVVMGNGNWLIIFTEPADAFMGSDGIEPNCAQIAIFPSQAMVLEYAGDLFRLLEYSRLSGRQQTVEAGEVCFLIDPKLVEGCLHALGVVYAHEQRWNQIAPRLTVAPLLLLRSTAGTFLRVEAPTAGFDVPMKGDPLLEHHLAEVEASALELKRQVQLRLGLSSLPTISLESHFGDANAFTMHPATIELDRAATARGARRFLIITGEDTHFIRIGHEFRGCPYHKHSASAVDGNDANSTPIAKPSTEPRSLFVDGNVCHCTHRVTLSIKSAQVDSKNRARCGIRSASDGEAFCELWSFENYLCCQVCVFQKVCSKSSLFLLPCPAAESHSI